MSETEWHEDDEMERDVCAVMVDTWGTSCAVYDCDEPMRTVGVEMFIDDDGETRRVVYVLCERHVISFFQDVIFARRVVGMVDEHGNTESF